MTQSNRLRALAVLAVTATFAAPLWFAGCTEKSSSGEKAGVETGQAQTADSASREGPWPSTIEVYRGSTPTVDGVLEEGEWDDASMVECCDGWNAQFSEVTDPEDLSAEVWIKHDGEKLYVAYDVTDNVLYGHDTERWVPDAFAEEFPNVHELSREGFPWYGDGVELLVNAEYEWSMEDNEKNKASGLSWQMICSIHKSRLGGVGTPGLLEGEERNIPGPDGESIPNPAWDNYTNWIRSGAMKAEVRIKDKESEGSGYVIEWMISPEPCLEVDSGTYWSPELGTTRMGLNIAVGDFDTMEDGEGNWGNFHHENWWAGEKDKRTWLKQWGTMVVHPGEK